MSYSFFVNGETKEAAKLAAIARYDEVVATQPVHSRDRVEAFDNLDRHLALLSEPKEGEVVGVSMHGSIWVESPHLGDAPERVRSAGSGCSVSVGPKA